MFDDKPFFTGVEFSGVNSRPTYQQSDDPTIFFCSFEPMKNCVHCNIPTPFQFHILCNHAETKYRVCWKHINTRELNAIREMYEIIENINAEAKEEVGV